MALRIWMNRTFATNHHVVKMLKDNPDGERVFVLGSHIDPASPVLAACDASFAEPVHLPGAEYVEFALATCREHDIDVFWPTWQQEAVAANAERFTDAGVAVLTSPAEAIALFEDKAATYAAAASLGVTVPDFEVVNTATAFADAYAALRSKGHEQVCFKPVTGVGGVGFRVLTEQATTIETLTAPVNARVPLDHALALLASRNTFDPLMVMPVLPGGEVSVDTVSLHGKILTAVPRFKRGESRAIELRHDAALIEQTALLVEHYALSYLSNVQFRFDADHNPYLLEVNTRASGGLFQSCLAGGNMPWYTVQAALRGVVDVPQPTFPVRLTTFPMAVGVTDPA